MQVTEPFKQRGVANVAAIFELSDGQTVSIFFHNPDVTPNKMAAGDEVISWKWLLNKKDITIVVAPERGEDLNVREVARRIIRLAEKNSPAFQRANTKRAERMQGIQALKDEITTLETELATAQHELEVAKVAAETAPARTLLTDEEQAALAKREEAARAILEGMTDEQITQVGASPSLVTVVTMKLGRFSAIDKILENHPDDVEKAIASVVTEASAKSAQQKADITYRNSADGLFTSFFPDTPEGEKAWNIINATPGAEGGKVLAAHAEPTIEQLRKAGYTVEEDTSAPSAVDDDALLAELAQKSGEQDGSPDVFSVGSVKFQAFAVKIRQGKQRVWGVRVLENGKEMNPADGNGAGFKSDTKASMIEDMERSYAAITKIGDKEQNENRWREGFGLPPLQAEGASASNEQALIDAYIKAWGEEAAMVNAAVAAVNWEGIIDNASATAEIQKLQSAANSERPIIKARDALEAAGMKTWDSRLSGVTETDEFQAQSKAMDAYREAMDKIQAIAKEKLIEAGKAELASLPEDASLEDAARAIYRKHGIDMGQRSDWVSRVVTAVNEKDAEALRSILAGVGSDSNKASMEIFERAAGFKLAKTQKERAKQIDEWAGITPEKRADIEAAKDAAWQARKTEEGVKDSWGWLKSMKVRDGADVVDGQQYLLRQFAEGYDEAGTGKKGAATIYGMKKGSALRYVNNRSFNGFLKAAMAFGGLRKALESVGAIEPVGNADGDKAVSVDAAYQFASATDEFKAWLADYLDKPEYSPFVTAKEMDQAAQRNGASVDWGMFSGAALDGVGAAVAELERALDVVATNEPINRAEGNIGQANLEAEVSDSIKEAIGILSEADYGPSEEEIGGLFEAESATLDSADGAYLGVEKQAISATKALLQYFRDFIASDAKFAKVPESAYGWTAAGEIMDKDEAKRRLRSLIDIAINRKAGIPDLTPEQDKRLADYAHDARTISDYLTKRIRHTGARNLLRTPEMKAKYPHIDNQPRDGLDSVSLDGIDSDGYVGKVKKGGEVVGRIDIGGDGKAMVFVGASGDQRVVFPSGTEATYSDEDAAAMIDALFSTKAANAAPEAIEGPAKDRASALKMLTDTGMNVWMSEGQNKAVIAGLMGEEWQFFADKMKELAGVIAAMPKTYDQDGMGDSAVAHLHYFRGAADWYITEKDMEGKGTQQAFGLADLGYGGELGYISIDELISAGVELDFHFAPKTVGQIKGKSEAGAPESQEKAPEVSPEDQQKQADQALFQSVIDGSIPDILAPELADSLESAYYRQQTDPALVSLFEQAVSAYQNAMMSATAELA